MNNKGFTLIELLLNILLIGIILTISIPIYNRYITNSRKSSMVLSAKAFISDIKRKTILQNIKMPVLDNDITVVSIDMIRDNPKSSFNKNYIKNKSYVLITNDGTLNNPSYSYYIALQDEGKNAVGLTKEEKLNRESVIENARNTMEVTVQNLYGNKEGYYTELDLIKGLSNKEDNLASIILLAKNYKKWNLVIYSNKEE